MEKVNAVGAADGVVVLLDSAAFPKTEVPADAAVPKGDD